MFVKADTDILLEGLSNPTVVGRKSDYLLASYVGTIEIVIEKDVTKPYLAVQIPSGEILGVDSENHVFSLSNKMWAMHWGYYPIDFPEEQKTRRSCPKAFKRAFEINVNTAGFETVDPFEDFESVDDEFKTEVDHMTDEELRDLIYNLDNDDTPA